MPDFEAQRIEDSLELEQLDEGLYRSIKLWKPVHGRGAFGGNIVAQAAHAATKSVGSEYHLHSLHCYFLSFGNVDIPVIYHVENLRSGRSYCTRSVKAVQQGKSIFILMASFHVPEASQLSFQQDIDMRMIPPPEKCVSTEARMQKLLEEQGSGMKPRIKEFLEREWGQRIASAIEIRDIGPMEDSPFKGDPKASQMIWIRSRARIRPDPAFQKLVLAYASDFRFIGTVGRALGLGARTQPRLAMMASLDHSMYFYDNEVDVSQWMLFQMECPRATDGRGVVIGRFYTRAGKLAVVCTQEGVCRAEDPKDEKLVKL